MEDKQERTYTIGHYELVMAKGRRGYHGHYTNKKNGMTNTFEAEGMTKKQVIGKFWDKLKEG